MPLYIEDLVSEETKEFMEWHLHNCLECTDLYETNRLSTTTPTLIEATGDKFLSAKKFLLKIRRALLACSALVLILIFLFTAGGFWVGSNSNNELLTLSDVTTVLKQHHLNIEKDKQESPSDYEYQGNKPAIYKLEQTQGKLFIYVFDSFEDRQRIYQDSGNEKKFHKLFSQSNETSVYHEARNILIVVNAPREALKSNPEVSKSFEVVKKVVFEKLNDGKEHVFKGQGEYWESQITVNYYEHWWKDENGVIKHESYLTEQPLIKYKGTDISSVGEIDYEYHTSAGGSSRGRTELDQNGYIKSAGYKGSNGVIPRENDSYTMTVEWNGKKETFTLTTERK